MNRLFFSIRNYTNRMKYLNVAEKNDAAKTISGYLSNGAAQRSEGLSPYNKLYKFKSQVRGQDCDMIMTSVSGHLLGLEFASAYRGWKTCNPIQLFDAPVNKYCPEDFVRIKSTLEREIRSCHGLIIWTDCDREGENIGYEIIEVCLKIKPNIPVYRAKFSEITSQSCQRALDNISPPDEKQSQAVDVRIELDLRIGAAFTRFQTLRLQQVFPQVIENLVSYGSCQIPTLGFVVQRYKEADSFIAQPFWKIKVSHTINELTVDFNWARNRLFDHQCCEAFFMICQANPTATVVDVTQKPKNKWRPTPLDTVEMEKLSSRKLKIPAKDAMKIAEKLYTQGIISYPRTETNIFSKEIDLRSLVQLQVPSPVWGRFAGRVLDWGPNPRNGKKSDQAHPPIHPTKFVDNLSGDEKKVYDLIVRHFLACVSKDATGSETIVYINVADEEFSATGLIIYERNYLEVYIYDKWNAKEIHAYEIGHTFEPTEISMPEGQTTAPSLLTEADLIALMEKHGIGTDATHAEHINTVKERNYIGEVDQYLIPGTLGMGLCEGYDAMELPLHQPKLRAELEADLKLICEGRKNPQEVLLEQIDKYRNAYRIIEEKALALDASIGQRFNKAPRQAPAQQAMAHIQEVCKCSKCGSTMDLKTKRDNNGFFISCSGYPACRNTIWMADMIRTITVSDEHCLRCGPDFKKVTIKFKQMSSLAVLNSNSDEYTSCLACDERLQNLLDINADAFRRNRPDPPVRNNQNQPRPPGGGGGGGGGDGGGNYPPRGGGGDFGPGRPNNPRGGNHGGGGDFGPGRPNNSFGGNNRNNNSDHGGGGDFGPGRPNNPRSGNNRNNNSDNGGMGGGERIPHNNNNNSRNDRRNSSSGGGDDVSCSKCNIPARRLITKKETVNKGRPFYTCPNSCGFFEWADVVQQPSSTTSNNWNNRTVTASSSSNNTNNSNSSSRNIASTSSGTSKQKRTNSAGSDAPARQRAKRKCGFCKQEGHTKPNCPKFKGLDS